MTCARDRLTRNYCTEEDMVAYEQEQMALQDQVNSTSMDVYWFQDAYCILLIGITILIFFILWRSFKKVKRSTETV